MNNESQQFQEKPRFRPRRKSRPNRYGVRRRFAFSSLVRMIFLANLFGLLILIIGALTLNRFSRGLIDAKVENLKSQTRLITNLLGDQATGPGTISVLDENAARQIMRLIEVPDKARVRLYGQDNTLVADTYLMDNKVEVGTLDPVVSDEKKKGPAVSWWTQIPNWFDRKVRDFPVYKNRRMRLQRRIENDVRQSLDGTIIAGAQYEGENLIVSVAHPVRRVQQILGSVVYETHDVDDILESQRQGLTPIILIAILASVFSSLALTLFIALPVRRLARAAGQVRQSSDKRNAIPDLSQRGDEIGDLSLVLRDMTGRLYDRIDDIANFAADVAHEIKNPLTSLRSASDTLRIAKTKVQRGKMIDIIRKDVERMDRLITDISKASRMDAALAKEPAQPLDLHKFLDDIADVYCQTRRETGVDVLHIHEVLHTGGEVANPGTEPLIVSALEISLGQVLRNLIDNALSFSPKDTDASVRLRARRGEGEDQGLALVTVDDDGPGIPADELEAIFDRFYTQRSQRAAFGGHSGLGLAICRQIMTAHNGSLSASNRTGETGEIEGARFTLKLPLHKQTRKRKKD